MPSGTRDELARSSRDCSWVKRSKPAASCSVNTPDRPVVVDDDHGAVGPLVDQAERVADGVVGDSVIGVSYTGWRDLTYVDDRLDHVERDVLRAARPMPPRRATVSAIRRPATAVMLRHDERDRRADAVGRREVDVEAADRPTTGWAP